jgi:hypothetical protein
MRTILHFTVRSRAGSRLAGQLSRCFDVSRYKSALTIQASHQLIGVNSMRSGPSNSLTAAMASALYLLLCTGIVLGNNQEVTS